MTIGEKIKKHRTEKGWSQDELAKQCGLNRNSIYKYEKGGTMPRMPQMKALSEALDVPLSYLLGDADAFIRIETKSDEDDYSPGKISEAMDRISKATKKIALSYNKDFLRIGNIFDSMKPLFKEVEHYNKWLAILEKHKLTPAKFGELTEAYDDLLEKYDLTHSTFTDLLDEVTEWAQQEEANNATEEENNS